MGIMKNGWQTLSAVIRMNDTVISLAETVKEQQRKLENYNERLIRLEAMLELLLRTHEIKKLKD